MILCCGEALIDFLPVNDSEGNVAFRPFNGGSIYNVAIALGRLGRPVGFWGGLSTDFFGEQLKTGLEESRVDLSLTVRSDRSSTLAFVRFENGEPQYAFVDEGSAGRMLQENDLPELPGQIRTLHFGSISLIHNPGGQTLETFARRYHNDHVVSLDPNIRAGQVKDRDAHLKRIEAMIGFADIVKLSDVDLNWIDPDAQPDVIAADWLKRGPQLVALTRGGAGATLYNKAGKIESKSRQVEVADTIGAGDTFMAGVLANLDEKGLLSKQRLSELDLATMQQAGEFAMRAAAVTVSRPGANPPWQHEL